MEYNREEDLLLEAIKTHYTNWMSIQKLIDNTDDERIKKRLRRVMKEKYHSEEYHNGLL